MQLRVCGRYGRKDGEDSSASGGHRIRQDGGVVRLLLLSRCLNFLDAIFLREVIHTDQ
jgi:hypothetical protein